MEIELLVEEIRNKTIGYLFLFWKNPDDAENRTVAATGRFTVVCVAFGEGSSASRGMKAVAIPDGVREKIEAAPPGLLERSEAAES